MLTILKTEDWRNIPPLEFYLMPLQNAVDDMRKQLLKMNDDGILRCKYILEENEELRTKIIHMVKMDNTA
jgi:CRISPR/Cas system-associated endonuclease/helicase Cas3